MELEDSYYPKAQYIETVSIKFVINLGLCQFAQVQQELKQGRVVF